MVPGTWAYHYYEPEESAPHFTFEITLFSGSLYLLSTRPGYPPSFTAMAAASYMQIVDQSPQDEAASYSITVCDGVGLRQYVGLYGGEAMATYVIHAAPFDGKCETGGEDEGYIEQRRTAATNALGASSAAQDSARLGISILAPLAVAAVALLGALPW